MKSTPIIDLGGMMVKNPDIEFFLDRIDNEEYFSWCKLNHAFWEMCSGHSGSTELFRDFHGVEFVQECVNELEIALPSNCFLGVSNCGPPGVQSSGASVSSIQAMAGHIDLYYGPLWKSYVIRNTFQKFVDVIRDRDVIVVGMDHLQDIGKTWGLKHFRHLNIGVDASDNRDRLLDEVGEMVEDSSVCLWQAGEMLSFWCLRRLCERHNAFFIDLGRVMDFYCKKIYLSTEDGDKMKGAKSKYRYLFESSGYRSFQIGQQPWFNYVERNRRMI